MPQRNCNKNLCHINRILSTDLNVQKILIILLDMQVTSSVAFVSQLSGAQLRHIPSATAQRGTASAHTLCYSSLQHSSGTYLVPQLTWAQLRHIHSATAHWSTAPAHTCATAQWSTALAHTVVNHMRVGSSSMKRTMPKLRTILAHIKHLTNFLVNGRSFLNCVYAFRNGPIQWL